MTPNAAIFCLSASLFYSTLYGNKEASKTKKRSLEPNAFSVLPAGRSEGGHNKPCHHEKTVRSNEVISPEVLKMRAALFCIFTYLDTKTLLRAAEVCRDWRFVARHPAVWTRVLLENARISSKVGSVWPAHTDPHTRDS